MPKNDLLVASVHAAILVHHLYTVVYTRNFNFDETQHPEVIKLRDYNFRMLTVWNMFFQVTYFSVAFVSDLVEIDGTFKKLSQLLRFAKGFIFTSLVFPTTVIVVVVFWGIFFIDRELIYPALLDQIIPKWTNHCMHTNILIVALLEILMVNQQLPKYKLSFNVYMAMILGYAVVLISTYFLNDVWIYGVFVEQNWLQRISTIAFCIILGAFSVKAISALELWKSGSKI